MNCSWTVRLRKSKQSTGLFTGIGALFGAPLCGLFGAERDKLRKMSSIESKVSFSEDGLPEVYGGQWAEDEQYLGKPSSEDNRMLIAEHVVKQVEDKVVAFLSKQRKGKRLLAVASLLAQGLSNRRICAVLRENGTKVSFGTVDNFVSRRPRSLLAC